MPDERHNYLVADTVDERVDHRVLCSFFFSSSFSFPTAWPIMAPAMHRYPISVCCFSGTQQFVIFYFSSPRLIPTARPFGIIYHLI